MLVSFLNNNLNTMFLLCDRCSRVSTKPVSVCLVGLKGLLSKLLVTTVLNCVDFKSVWVCVNIMILCEQIRNWVESSNNAKGHHKYNFCVRNFWMSEIWDVLCNVVSHLRSGGRSAIIVLNHTIMKLWGHSNNHVIKVRIEVTAFWYIKTKWWCIVITSEQVIWVVSKTRLMGTSFWKLWWPNTLISIFCLMDSHVWWPDSVMDLTLSKVPLLEVIWAVLLMTWMDLGQVNHLASEFNLSETFINKKIVLLMHSSVTTLTSSAENFETSSQSI